MNGIDRPLPIRPRPRPGESPEEYVTRLAVANHLRPSYLRRYLVNRPGGMGPVDPERLAALTARTPEALTRALPGLQPRPRAPGTGAAAARRRDALDQKTALYQALRADHENGLSGRALQRKHHVGSRTVRYALADPEPLASKKKPDRTSPHKHVRPHIDAMIAENPKATTTTIWEHLLDQHHATISYSAVRRYLRPRRDLTTSPRQTEDDL